MKPLLRTLLLLTAVGYSYVVNAQTGSCTVTDLIVQNVRPDPDNPCTYTFDVAFTTASNSAKYVYLQSYIRTATVDNYPNYFRCINGTPSQQGAIAAPTFANLNRIPFLNILIDNSGADPVFSPTYPADPTGLPIRGVVSSGTMATPSSVDTFTLANGDIRFNLYGLRADVPAPVCVNGTVEPFLLISDVFATNAENASVIQCVSCQIPFAVAFFTTQAVANCNTGDLTVTLTSNSQQAFTGTWQLFVDVNENRLFTPGIDVPIIAAPLPFSLDALGTTSFTYTVPAQYLDFNVILNTQILTGFGAGSSSTTILVTCGAGAPLPVKFKSFNASRKNADVLLSWETASEDNNRGFYVQRNNGSGWKDLGFVASKATDGNSTGDLAYNYTDVNNTTKGVTQYRIMQVDIDGKARLSEIRQVRGLAQSGKVTVYPNPSGNGKVNVVFDDSKAIWNVSVADMNGRIIKQFKEVTNSVLVDNLLPGMYMIRIVDTQTGTQTAEKVIVNNH